jgi:Uma2 family endonuclease
MYTQTATVLPATQYTVSTGEQRVILHGVRWETYEHLLADCAESHAAYFTYDRGVLEIMVLSFEHEQLKHTLATLVEVLAEEFEIDMIGGGSTTFRREDLARGFEPDACFYIQHAEQIRGKKRLELPNDPPPDLVIEIDLTSPSLDKFPIFVSLGVPEVWRYDGQALTIFRLREDTYTPEATSTALPGLLSEGLTRLLAEGQILPRPAWFRSIRAWAQTLRTTGP